MTHDFDPRSLFCTACGMPLRALHEHRDLDDCSPENERKWRAREAARIARIEREAAARERTRQIDAQPLPPNLTWGDIRRALNIAQWPE